MKKCLFVLLIYSGLTGLPGISAQEFLQNLDSVPLVKPKKGRTNYIFSDNGTKEIKIYTNRTEWIEHKVKGSGWREFRRDMFTAITGIGISSETDSYFRITNKILCSDTLPDWNVILFCEGYIQTDRERVRDSDGSSSVETTETNVYLWEKNARGLLIEGNDTIGDFLISINPLQDQMFHELPSVFRPLPEESESTPNRKVFASWLPEAAKDFGMIGVFRDRKFGMVHIGSGRKVWIFTDEALFGIFQMDLIYPGLAKKYYIKPCLFINPNISPDERRDLFRLAMVSKVLNGSIGNKQ
jgi:hypothetical protein